MLVEELTFRISNSTLQKYGEIERRADSARNFPPCGGVGLKKWNSVAQAKTWQFRGNFKLIQVRSLVIRLICNLDLTGVGQEYVNDLQAVGLEDE